MKLNGNYQTGSSKALSKYKYVDIYKYVKMIRQPRGEMDVS